MFSLEEEKNGNKRPDCLIGFKFYNVFVDRKSIFFDKIGVKGMTPDRAIAPNEKAAG